MQNQACQEERCDGLARRSVWNELLSQSCSSLVTTGWTAQEKHLQSLSTSSSGMEVGNLEKDTENILLMVG